MRKSLINKTCAQCGSLFITTNQRKKFHKRICERRFNASHYIIMRIEKYHELVQLASKAEERKAA